MTTSLNDLEAQLAALERASSDDEVMDDQDAASNVSSEVDSESDVVFSSDDEGPAAGPAGGSSPGAAGGKRKSKGKKHGDEQQRSSGARPGTSCNEADTSGTPGACAAGSSRPQTEKAKAAKQRVRDHVRKGFSKVCFRFLRDNACHFENCLFEHKKLSELSDAELIALRKELEFKPFCEKLALKIQNLNIPVCKEYKQYGSCSVGEAKCRYWHLKNAAVAKWAGFGYWCEACWKPITSLEAWEEHVKSKRHREMVAGRGEKVLGSAESSGGAGADDGGGKVEMVGKRKTTTTKKVLKKNEEEVQGAVKTDEPEAGPGGSCSTKTNEKTKTGTRTRTSTDAKNKKTKHEAAADLTEVGECSKKRKREAAEEVDDKNRKSKKKQRRGDVAAEENPSELVTGEQDAAAAGSGVTAADAGAEGRGRSMKKQLGKQRHTGEGGGEEKAQPSQEKQKAAAGWNSNLNWWTEARKPNKKKRKPKSQRARRE